MSSSGSQYLCGPGDGFAADPGVCLGIEVIDLWRDKSAAAPAPGSLLFVSGTLEADRL